MLIFTQTSMSVQRQVIRVVKTKFVKTLTEVIHVYAHYEISETEEIAKVS